MSHTYCSSLFHCVFSTKERRKTIVPDIQPRLWAYIGGVAREHEMKALASAGWKTMSIFCFLFRLPLRLPMP